MRRLNNHYIIFSTIEKSIEIISIDSTSHETVIFDVADLEISILEILCQISQLPWIKVQTFNGGHWFMLGLEVRISFSNLLDYVILQNVVETNDLLF